MSLDRKLHQISAFPAPFNKSTALHDSGDFDARTRHLCSNYSNELTNRSFKLIVLGDISVGKTCLINRFCHQVFNSFYKATIGVDFEIEMFSALETPFLVQIWDTAGQERFKCIAQAYYRRAHAILLVFDMSSLKSMEHCSRWLNEALSAGNSPQTLVFLAGNKKDLLSKAAYSNMLEISQMYAERINAEFWPLSAKTGENVKKMFLRLAALVFDLSIQKENLTSNNILIGTNLASFTSTHDTKKRNAKCNQCLIST